MYGWLYATPLPRFPLSHVDVGCVFVQTAFHLILGLDVQQSICLHIYVCATRGVILVFVCLQCFPVFSALLFIWTDFFFLPPLPLCSTLQITANPFSSNYFCQATGTQVHFRAATVDFLSVESNHNVFLYFRHLHFFFFFLSLLYLFLLYFIHTFASLYWPY